MRDPGRQQADRRQFFPARRLGLGHAQFLRSLGHLLLKGVSPLPQLQL